MRLIDKAHVAKLIFCYKKQILLLFLLDFFSSGFTLVIPYISKLFIDKAFINKDFREFLNLSVCGIILFIITIFFTALADIVKNRVNIKLKLRLTNKFIKKFYSLDLAFFQGKSVGENVYRLYDIDSVSSFLLEQCPQILVDVFKMVIILAVSLWLNMQMTVFLLILSPLFLVHRFYIQNKLMSIYDEIWEFKAKMSKEIYEAFSGILIIKALGLESYQRWAHLKTMLKNIRWKIKSFRWSIIGSLSSSFLSKVVYGMITLYGGWLIIKGRLSVGGYAAAMLYLTQLGGLLEQLGSRFEFFMKGTVSLEKFFEIMDSPEQIKDLPTARNLESAEEGIRFKQVWFGYGSGRPVLKNIDFTIPATSWVAIVGPSGCGKTTLVNLILRLYEPWRGEIFLGDLELKNIKLKSLREKISIATQHPFLFDVSIRENISYGLRSTSFDAIEEAAKVTCVHDYITHLPQGYDTLIGGDDACRLSQGLKQRITLARAVLRNPYLLILDEATSSVDSFTEEKIFQNLRQKRRGLVTIVISHRLSSVKDADRIYFLDGNEKIEEGTHLNLLAGSDMYRDFFRNQIDGNLR